MSDEEQVITETQVLTAEFKDGQLEIVEVTPFDNNEANPVETHILPDMSEGSEEEPKYQILTDSPKGLLQLDLLNLTLVKCGDGEESYRLMTNQEADGLAETVTCVLQTSDNEADDSQTAYLGKKQVYLTGDDPDTEHEQYVMVEGEDGPVVLLQPGQQKKLSAVELLEKAKALQKAKAQMQPVKRGRKRRGCLPPPHELLSSPNFKLFLYSCKLCQFKCNAIKELTQHKVITCTPHELLSSPNCKLFLYSCKLCQFKCNAIKELTQHKTSEHSDGGGRARGGARAAAATLQCARCPFRGATHSQLMKHVQEHHLKDTNSAEVYLNSAEAEAADVLVCGACGFESSSRPVFRRHIEEKHSVSTS